MDYGKKIAYLRKSHGMTQEELGKTLNVTYQAVSKWERGESLPDFETMSQIAKYFQVPLSYFTDDEVTYQQSERTINNVIGMCTECGKMLNEDEVYCTSPRIVCKSCAERIKRERAQQKAAEQASADAAKARMVAAQRGSGFDFKLAISVILPLVCYVLFTIFTLNGTFGDNGLGGFVTFLVPLAVFGCIHAVADFINDLRDAPDDTDGYTRNLSLVIGGVFAVINLVCFLILYLSTHETVLIFMMILGVILSFTFVSQYCWGGVIGDIFTAGGFTFKLPGFIFSLEIESILFMLIAKLFLGIIAALLFVVTTVIMALIAILGSVITFIPSVIMKSAKDKKAAQD
ncbi:MAG: helix-turn-helix domain-containing protein [Clostridia bacterium]|nr:helix-turn-helix domain-containing protein [Clostridia bacterium]